MYGTVAKMKLKAGAEPQMQELMREFEQLSVPGHVSSFVYRMDSVPDEYYLTVVFQDRETYRANADSPEQNERYEKMAALFDGAPEWHDGEIVYQG